MITVKAILIPEEYEQHFPITIDNCRVTIFTDTLGRKCVPARILDWELLEDKANNANLAPPGSLYQQLWQWAKAQEQHDVIIPNYNE